jgi:hypothetical protein
VTFHAAPCWTTNGRPRATAKSAEGHWISELGIAKPSVEFTLFRRRFGDVNAPERRSEILSV